MNLSEEDTGWLAGIIEGEGYFGGQIRQQSRAQNPTYDPVIRVGMTDEDIVQRLLTVTTVGHVNGPYLNKRENCKPVYVWTVQVPRDVAMVVHRILHLLGERRQRQADRTLGIAELAMDCRNHGLVGRWNNEVRSRYITCSEEGCETPRHTFPSGQRTSRCLDCNQKIGWGAKL